MFPCMFSVDLSTRFTVEIITLKCHTECSYSVNIETFTVFYHVELDMKCSEVSNLSALICCQLCHKNPRQCKNVMHQR